MTDVIIVGSGPAGMSAAFFLSFYQDIKVTVLERLGDEQYNRYHEICGGGISKRTFSELSPMKPAGILNEIEQTRIIWPDGTVVKMRTKGYILDRPAFLSELRKGCKSRGVKFIKGTVTDIEYDGRYTVRTYSIVITVYQDTECTHIAGTYEWAPSDATAPGPGDTWASWIDDGDIWVADVPPAIQLNTTYANYLDIEIVFRDCSITVNSNEAPEGSTLDAFLDVAGKIVFSAGTTDPMTT